MLMHLENILRNSKFANQNFETGTTLQGIVTDWSDAEIKGLKSVIGEENATKLLGCKVHWLRSCERVSECISTSSNKQIERNMFMKTFTKCCGNNSLF